MPPQPAFQRVKTSRPCAVVFGAHGNWTDCVAGRAKHVADTVPGRCDVVVLLDTTASADPELVTAAARRSLRGRAHARVVPFEQSLSLYGLRARGYGLEAVHAFSPYHSRLSKVMWFAWAARQEYTEFWFAESDVLMLTPWRRLLLRTPMHRKPNTEYLLTSKCITDGAWFWAGAGCSFCQHETKHCLVPLHGASAGLVRAIDAAIRRGLRGHHEALVPYVCATQLKRRCSHKRLDAAFGLKGLVTEPVALRRASMRAARESVAEARQYELLVRNGSRSTANASDFRHLPAELFPSVTVSDSVTTADLSASASRAADRKFSVVFHPVKCPPP